jgi:hypothetical protein
VVNSVGKNEISVVNVKSQILLIAYLMRVYMYILR